MNFLRGLSKLVVGEPKNELVQLQKAQLFLSIGGRKQILCVLHCIVRRVFAHLKFTLKFTLLYPLDTKMLQQSFEKRPLENLIISSL